MRAVIDRITEGRALLLCGDEEIPVELPRELLPPGAAEGDILAVSLQIDHQATAEQRKKIERLLGRLTEEPEQ